MAHIGEIELAILKDLERRGPCTLEELVQRLPGYGWNQVFAAVDRLSRKETLTLKYRVPFDYLVSVGSHDASLPGPQAQGGK